MEIKVTRQFDHEHGYKVIDRKTGEHVGWHTSGGLHQILGIGICKGFSSVAVRKDEVIRNFEKKVANANEKA